MKRSRRVEAFLFAVVACLLLSAALYAAPLTEHTGPSLEAASICASAPWVPHASITRGALRELRNRMARYDYPTGLCITGPFERDCRAPESVEEAWLLEKLYGPPQRWVLAIVPLWELAATTPDPGEFFLLQHFSGLSVGILTSKTVSRLSIELAGDAVRVYELDA
jgi:hypothetical protein